MDRIGGGFSRRHAVLYRTHFFCVFASVFLMLGFLTASPYG